MNGNGRFLCGLMIGSAVFAIVNYSASAQTTQPGAMPRLASDELFQGPARRAGRPIEAFKGCEVPERLQATVSGSEDRLRSRNASTNDPTTARVFASFPLSEGVVSVLYPDTIKAVAAILRQV
ncbi:MAG: hypothetical protein AAFN76_12415, partial [Pseudomonadota bacterium]